MSYPRPDDIPAEDWANILKGTAFAQSVAEVTAGVTDADAMLDYAGEIEQALNGRGYSVVPTDDLIRLHGALEMVADMVPISRLDVHEVIAAALDGDPLPVFEP